VKDVGKPCKGEPYARIDGGRLETEAPSTVTTGGTTQRETAGMKALGPTDDHATAPASYPPRRVLPVGAVSPPRDPLLGRINAYLMRWLRKKHKRLRGRKRAQEAWTRAVTARPRFFAHWAWVPTVPAVW
jgi:hypothetical protein